MSFLSKFTKGGKAKKGLFTALIAGCLVVAMAVPAFGSYFDPLIEPSGAWTTGGYEGAVVQRNTYSSTPFLYSPNGQLYMTMALNEAMVTSGLSYGFRWGIAGKVGTGMVKGCVDDARLQVIRNSTGVKVMARTALTARDVNGNPLGIADVPSGAQLTYPTTDLLAYKDGSMIKIDGYWVGSSWYSRACYVNNNWGSGSVSSYYVYFQ
jgi:hypothetical protein